MTATRTLEVNGIEHAVFCWGSPEHDPVLLLHGAKDRGTSFDEVGPALADRGWYVNAPDLRGYGETGPGASDGAYQLEFYVSDIAELVDALSPTRPIVLVGHSFGGVLATLYAGTYPQRVGKLAVVEGLGSPHPDAESPARLRRWIQARRRDRARPPRRITPEHAAHALRSLNPELDAQTAQRRAQQLTVEADGQHAWWFDDQHWHTLFDLTFARWRAHASCVTAPTLVVSGGETGHHPPDEAERLGCYPNLRTADLPGGGHMVHWSRPAELAALLGDFMRS